MTEQYVDASLKIDYSPTLVSTYKMRLKNYLTVDFIGALQTATFD